MNRLSNQLKPLFHLVIFMTLLVFSASAAQSNGQIDMDKKAQAVAAIHAKYDSEIIAVEGVVSVGIGLSKDGEPCLKIGTSGPTDGIYEKLPDDAKEVCVEVEQVGNIEAQ